MSLSTRRQLQDVVRGPPSSLCVSGTGGREHVRNHETFRARGDAVKLWTEKDDFIVRDEAGSLARTTRLQVFEERRFRSWIIPLRVVVHYKVKCSSVLMNNNLHMISCSFYSQTTNLSVSTKSTLTLRGGPNHNDITSATPQSCHIKHGHKLI